MASSGYPLVVVAEGYTDYPTFMRQGKFQLSCGAIVNIGLLFAASGEQQSARADKKRAAILFYRSGNRIGFLQDAGRGVIKTNAPGVVHGDQALTVGCVAQIFERRIVARIQCGFLPPRLHIPKVDQLATVCVRQRVTRRIELERTHRASLADSGYSSQDFARNRVPEFDVAIAITVAMRERSRVATIDVMLLMCQSGLSEEWKSRVLINFPVATSYCMALRPAASHRVLLSSLKLNPPVGSLVSNTTRAFITWPLSAACLNCAFRVRTTITIVASMAITFLMASPSLKIHPG